MVSRSLPLFQLSVWCEKCVAARHYCVIGKQLWFATVLRIRIRIRIHRIHMFLGLQDPDPPVRGMDPDPDPYIIMQK